MSWVAAAVIGSTLVSGYLGNRAAGKAADAQERAAQLAQQENARQYDLTRADMSPYRDIGKASLGQLGYGMGLPGYDTGTGKQGSLTKNFSLADFVKDPGYDFRMSEGLKGVENSGSARGMQLSGATLKALNQYGQNLASNEYQNAYNRYNTDQGNQFNRLSGIAGTGQTATSQLGQLGGQMASNNANLIAAGGNARAAGIMGQSNAYTGAMNQGLNYWMQNQYLNKLPNYNNPNTSTPSIDQNGGVGTFGDYSSWE